MSGWTVTALLVALAGPPLCVGVSTRLFGESPGLSLQIVLHALYCGLAAFVLWVAIHRDRLPLSSLGVRRPDWSTVVLPVGILLVASVVLPIFTTPLAALLADGGLQRSLESLTRQPAWFRVVVGLTGGVVEELLYRGYAIERLSALTGRRWLGGTLAALAFGLAHIPAWGIGFSLAVDLPFGILMTLAYLWRRDLVANMLAHSLGLVYAMLRL